MKRKKYPDLETMLSAYGSGKPTKTQPGDYLEYCVDNDASGLSTISLRRNHHQKLYVMIEDSSKEVVSYGIDVRPWEGADPKKMLESMAHLIAATSENLALDCFEEKEEKGKFFLRIYFKERKREKKVV